MRRPVFYVLAGYGCAIPTHPRGLMSGRIRTTLEADRDAWRCPVCGGRNIMTGIQQRRDWSASPPPPRRTTYGL